MTETPEWTCDPRPWDAEGCCPLACVACEPLELPAGVVLGEN